MAQYWTKNRLYVVIRQLEKARIILDDNSECSQTMLSIIDSKIKKYKDQLAEINNMEKTNEDNL